MQDYLHKMGLVDVLCVFLRKSVEYYIFLREKDTGIFVTIFPNFKIPHNKHHDHTFSSILAPVRPYNAGSYGSYICF